MTGKRPVWYEYTFTASTTVAKTIRVSAFMGSIVIDTCVDLAFLLLGSGAMTLVNIHTLALMLILANVEKQLSIAYINMDSIGKKICSIYSLYQA